MFIASDYRYRATRRASSSVSRSSQPSRGPAAARANIQNRTRSSSLDLVLGFHVWHREFQDGRSPVVTSHGRDPRTADVFTVEW
jgi:hypothetical protein